MPNTVTWTNFMTTQAGHSVAAWEQTVFSRLNRSISGLRAVQIGLSSVNVFDRCPITHRILIEPHAVRLPVLDLRQLVLAQPDALPIANESVDYVVLPHGLDRLGVNLTAVLAEIERILVPNGIVATSFFNARGTWALSKKWICRSPLPKDVNPLSVSSVRTALALAGLPAEGGHFGVYGINHALDARGMRPTWMDKAGDRWWPTMGNVAMLYARKRVNGMTLVGKNAFRKMHVPLGASVLTHKQADQS